MPVSTNRARNFDSSVTRFCNFFEQKQGLVEKLKHRNKINHLLKVSKINYYTAYFRQSQGNSKKNVERNKKNHNVQIQTKSDTK